MASLSAQTILCIALVLTTSLIMDVNATLEGGPREFDYFALALQWPDGLWPDYNDGTWPSCCARARFDVKEISPLMDALEKYWPSLYCSRSSTCFSGKGIFWAHEVDITCMSLYIAKSFCPP
ncbi:Mediator of RNA polymerase II transcription subunit 19 [Hibiscus syriacus]|uniref:Mediator of RNA polymerase II transcription subunit 19 n=1 Tax=Hibiscus syriacus TaxID=106335 RepID=A0A6A2WQL8_HIBSY|nr:Mediator of RNA polymerase II transcription subunit 19 [Hibiscus syriacus]